MVSPFFLSDSTVWSQRTESQPLILYCIECDRSSGTRQASACIIRSSEGPKARLNQAPIVSTCAAAPLTYTVDAVIHCNE